MITDNFGNCLASLLTNVGGASQGKIMTGSVYQVPVSQSAVAWGTIAGRYGIWGTNNSVASGVPYVQLGTGVTPVARSDFKTETPLAGAEGARVNVNNGSGYGSGLVNLLQAFPPITVGQTVAEGTVFINGSRNISQQTTDEFWALLRYNYTPTPVSIGEVVSMEVIITV